MTSNEIKEYVHQNSLSLLERVKIGYKCIVCENGSGESGTGMITKDDIHFYCPKCGSRGDIFDLIGIKYNIDNFNEKMEAVVQEYNLDYDNMKNTLPSSSTFLKEGGGVEMVDAKKNKELTNYGDYFKMCNKNLNESQEAIKYINSRGISLETANKLMLGYDDKWKANEDISFTTKRIILPTSNYSYTARAVENVDKNQKVFKVGPANLFNVNKYLLQDKGPIFIVEGEFDALSFAEVGYRAISMSSIANKELLVNKTKELLDNKSISANTVFILSLDNDEAGYEASKKVMNMFEKTGINYINYPLISMGYKDANDALVYDKEGFIKQIQNAIYQAKLNEKNINCLDYIKYLYKNEMMERKEVENLNLGFVKLQNYLAPLYPSLIVLAAGSSMGKTTFCLQLIDQIVKNGGHGIYFSFEQTKAELISKLLIKYDYEVLKNDNIDNEISEELFEAFTNDIKNLKLSNLDIVKCNAKSSIEFIENYVDEYINENNAKPVVVVDYLQLIQTQYNDVKRLEVDDVVARLKNVAEKYKTIVIAISSINRSSYNQDFNFTSYKESGVIEYSADICLSIQNHCLTEVYKEQKLPDEKTIAIMNKKEKEKDVRKVDIVCIKNRNNKPSFSVCFNYKANKNFFQEV